MLAKKKLKYLFVITFFVLAFQNGSGATRRSIRKPSTASVNEYGMAFDEDIPATKTPPRARRKLDEMDSGSAGKNGPEKPKRRLSNTTNTDPFAKIEPEVKLKNLESGKILTDTLHQQSVKVRKNSQENSAP